MREIAFTKTFRRDVKRLQKQGKNCSALSQIYQLLSQKTSLPSHYLDHALKGSWKGHREMHLENDLLLIYTIVENTVYLVRIGSHAELLNK
jgi:mRNA interferase YafQ